MTQQYDEGQDHERVDDERAPDETEGVADGLGMLSSEGAASPDDVPDPEEEEAERLNRLPGEQD